VGTPLGLYRDELGDEYQITLRLSEYIEPKLATFDDIMLPTPKGQLVPLLQVAQVVPESSLARFQHYSTERMASVLADVAPGYVTARVAKALKQELDGTAFPEGISIRFGGEEAGREEAFGGMGMATIVAVLAILAVLVLQFKSLAQPLIIFTAIPFAAIGSSLALLLTGNTFSFTAFVGITSLVGIVVNNSIILVDYANQMRSEGENVQEAIAAAAHTRFIPILLTTITTIVGLVPLTLSGSSMWAPLCWVIIGGLSVSTIMTLMVVPVLYQIYTKES
jgi:multidrug efflux pump subunit AcrB